jgi:hypothetical protein
MSMFRSDWGRHPDHSTGHIPYERCSWHMQQERWMRQRDIWVCSAGMALDVRHMCTFKVRDPLRAIHDMNINRKRVLNDHYMNPSHTRHNRLSKAEAYWHVQCVRGIAALKETSVSKEEQGESFL